MNMVLKTVLLTGLVLLLLVGVWMLIVSVASHLRTRKHQKEWDAIKRRMAGKSDEAIDDAYMEYMDRLMRKHSIFGTCIPNR